MKGAYSLSKKVLVIFGVGFFVALLAISWSPISLQAGSSGEESSLLTPFQSQPSDSAGLLATDYDWLVLNYIDGDNNLETEAIGDLNELEEAKISSSRVMILALVDRTSGYDDSNGDWTGTRLYEITHDTDSDTIASTLLVDYGELNMGQASTLELLLNYGLANYSTTNIWLNIWDHGGGVDGICWDDTSGSDYLSIEEMQLAITTSLSLYGGHLNLVSHDACFMNMIEVAYELKDFTEYFVASEDSIPGMGYNYTAIIDALESDTTMNASTLAGVLVDAYRDMYDSITTDVTLSALNLTFISDFAVLTDYLARNLTAVLNDGQISAVKSAFLDSYDFYDNYIIDYKDFVDQLLANTTLMSSYPDLHTIATSVQSAFSDLVVANYQHSSYSGKAHGVTIFMPIPSSTYQSYIDNYIDHLDRFAGIDWLANVYWDEFLDLFYGLYDTTSTYPTISLDELLTSQAINDGESQFFEFTALEDTIYLFSLSVLDGDVDLYLLDYYTEDIIAYSQLYNPDDGSEEEIQHYFTAGKYLIEIYGFESSHYNFIITQEQPISLQLNTQVSGSSGSQEGTDSNHYMQIFNHFYQITLLAGDYQVTLTYDSSVVDFDLFLLDINFNEINKSSSIYDKDEIVVSVHSEKTFNIMAYSYSGHGSFNLIVTVYTPSSQTSPSGFIPGFTATIALLGLLGLSTIIFIRKKGN